MKILTQKLCFVPTVLLRWKTESELAPVLPEHFCQSHRTLLTNFSVTSKWWPSITWQPEVVLLKGVLPCRFGCLVLGQFDQPPRVQRPIFWGQDFVFQGGESVVVPSSHFRCLLAHSHHFLQILVHFNLKDKPTLSNRIVLTRVSWKTDFLKGTCPIVSTVPE